MLHGSIPDAPGFDPDELPGFLVRIGDLVSSTVAVQPWRDLLVCHDWFEDRPEADHVVPVSEISELVAHLAVRRPVERALDIGTGSGVQAVLAGAHAREVVATDLNPRALQLAQWTLALNGTENVLLREGDWFEPVGDERFDLVVADLPFIVSPDHALLFRDAPPGTARAVVEGAADRLREWGFAHVLCQWPLTAGEAWDAQPRAWVENRGCDAWLLRVSADQDPVEYAAHWNSYIADADLAEFERALDRWLEHFSDAGIERIAFGVVSIRRRNGPNWTRSDDLDVWPTAPAGDHVARIFDGQTLVSTLSDDALLDLVVVPVPGLRLDETRSFDGGGFELVAAQPRLQDGVALRPRLSRAALEAIGRLDGTRRLRDLDAERALPHLRDLIALGFLQPIA